MKCCNIDNLYLKMCEVNIVIKTKGIWSFVSQIFITVN